MTEPTRPDAARIDVRRQREDYNVFSRLPAVYAASRTQGQRLLATADLSIVEWRVLWDLHEVGPMTIRDLALIQRSDPSLLSRALPEMRRKGFVEMHRSETDARQTIVALTEAGRAAYQRAAPIMARRRAALREVFAPDEIEAFVGYLDRLEAFLRTGTEELLQKEPAE
jgi:DNA-binding MarR family transcriptional regulator